MATERKKNFKKRLLIALAALAALLLVMYLLTLILPKIFNSITEDGSEEGTANFNFYTPDYDENIYEDENYLALIESGVLTYDNGTNSMVAINPDNASEHGDAVKLLTDYVYSIIDGDVEEHNSYFSKKYYETKEPKTAFTMQKIYNGTITYYSAEGTSENGNNYTKYIYKLKYYIRENNGTYRMDIGEDAKTQYVVITDREGKLLIDYIGTSNYKLS